MAAKMSIPEALQYVADHPDDVIAEDASVPAVGGVVSGATGTWKVAPRIARVVPPRVNSETSAVPVMVGATPPSGSVDHTSPAGHETADVTR